MVFQRRCGTLARSLCPRGAHPLSMRAVKAAGFDVDGGQAASAPTDLVAFQFHGSNSSIRFAG
jgi:hypothetical protein